MERECTALRTCTTGRPVNCTLVEPGLCIQRLPCEAECGELTERYGEWSKCIKGIQERNISLVYCRELEVTQTFTERAECEVLPLVLDYYPSINDLVVPYNSGIKFWVLANDESRLNGEIMLKVRWYADDVFIREYKQTMSKPFSIESEFLKDFASDGKVTAEVVQDEYSSINITWNIKAVESDCEEDWVCYWSPCNEYYYKHPKDCVDENRCRTNLNYPEPRKCTCKPEFNCTEWGECYADYNLKDLVEGRVIVEGKQERICVDPTLCVQHLATESRPCDMNVPVEIKKAEWCNEDYIEVYDKGTGKLVSRIKESADLTRLQLSLMPTSVEGYCSYCFDGVMNYNEEGVDCGGSCMACVEEYKDNFLLVKAVIEVLITFALAYFAYMLIKLKPV